MNKYLEKLAGMGELGKIVGPKLTPSIMARKTFTKEIAGQMSHSRLSKKYVWNTPTESISGLPKK